MKIKRALAILLLVGLFASSCATVSRLNAEYEAEMAQETARVAAMTPEAKAEWLKTERERKKINWDEYSNGDNN